MTTASTSPAVTPLPDGADLAALNAGNPLGWIADWWRGMAPDPDLPIFWWQVVVDDRPAGFAALARAPLSAGGFGNVLVHVLPAFRRRGAGAALRRVVEDAATGHLPGIVYFYDDRDADAEAAVEAWRLTVSERHAENVLDLTGLDRDELERLAGRPEVGLVPLDGLDTLTHDDWATLHRFLVDRFQEAPDSVGGGGQLTVAFLRELVTDPSHVLCAVEHGQRIGITVAMPRPGDPTARNTFFTGVTPAARGRGIALALKAHQALALADAGAARLFTQNMVGNEPILAANRRLGFVRDSGYCEVPVSLSPTSAPSAHAQS